MWKIPYLNTRRTRGDKAAAGESSAKEHVTSSYLDIARLTVNDALLRLESAAQGLSEAEAARRLRAHGPNAVAQEKKRGIAMQLLIRFWTPLNVMLFALALVSYFLSDPRAAVTIATMVILSVGLSFVQEYRSQEAAAKLRAMVRTTVTVLRRPERNPSSVAPAQSPSDGPSRREIMAFRLSD